MHSSSQKILFADVVLPLALPRTLTYMIPPGLEEHVVSGVRVVVQLGKSKLYTAIILRTHHDAPEAYEPKPILSVIDSDPVIHPVQLKFWEWMSSYYLCTLGEVMNAALPSGLKLSSESKIIRREDAEVDPATLNDREYLIMEALEMQPYITMDDVSKILGIKTIHSYLRSLQQKGLILVEQELREKFQPKFETYIRLAPVADNEDTLRKIFDELIKAPKQLQTLMLFIHLSSRYSGTVRDVKKTDMLRDERASAQAIRELVKKNVLVEEKLEVGRFGSQAGEIKEVKELSEEQEAALENIASLHKEKEVVLIHGVTGSGKTELYIKLIREMLDQRKQVLYLLPEIALTTQLIERIRHYFPGKVGVYHSKFNENERVEVWNNVLNFDPARENNPFQIILGARSSVFLPFSHLGLVVVDEEHETSFKQYDPDPRYHGRDAAIYLASVHGAKVVLGSATPSVETYYNAKQGKYGLVELKRRYGNVQLPEIFTSDLSEAYRKKRMKGHYSPMMLEAIQTALDQREQVILFQNRRGYSLILTCNTCGWTPHCKNCDISLIYHKSTEQLRCHYCGYSVPMVQTCAACGHTDLTTKGFGTEKVEDELQQFFPKAKIARLDLDTTRKKHAYREILQDFADGAIDILVGTQMVTKGLDFDNVSLVGVLNADNLLHFPDFRANERAYQLMAQVSGRAGRRKKRGSVVIQTMNPYHVIIQQVIRNDYESMYKQEILERKNFKYPPFYRLIHISLRNSEFNEVKEVAKQYAKLLKQDMGDRVLGPEIPSVSRIRNQFIFSIMIRIERGVSLPEIKRGLLQYHQQLSKDPMVRRTKFIFDVDPS